MMTKSDMVGAIVWRARKMLMSGNCVEVAGQKFRYIEAGQAFTDDAGQDLTATEASVYIAMRALVCEVDVGVAEGYLRIGGFSQWSSFMTTKLAELSDRALAEHFADLGRQQAALATVAPAATGTEGP